MRTARAARNSVISTLLRCTSARAYSLVPVNTAPSSRPELYDREREREELDKVRKSEPTAVIVLVGPPSCGKTALLRDSYLNHAHAVYIDCREAAASTPGSFLSYMLTKLLKKVPVDAQKQAISVLKSIFQGVLKIPNTMKFTEGSTDSVQWDLQVAGFFKALGDSFNAAPKESDAGLGQVTAAFSELLDAWKKTLPDGEWPVLVIDEANAMMRWQDEEYKNIKQCLLDYFVFTTKQQNRSHVIMATSEYGYQAWLNKAIGAGKWQPEVIGDFEQSHARGYLQWKLAQKDSSIVVDDDAWAKVYEVCGGNPGYLNRLAVMVHNVEGNWDRALEKLASVEEDRIMSLAAGGKGYTAEQYAVAAVQLLDAKHHAVAKEEMQLRLGRLEVGASAKAARAREAGVNVLQQLVEANVLSVRPYSDWAYDIPAEAFAHAKVVVTAPSTMDLYWLKRIRPQLDETLEQA